jgi:DNA polymerase III alpha subunit (gram-positive type)
MIKERIYGKTIPEILEYIEQFKGKTLIFFDTETTGLEPNRSYEQITQIAAISINGDDWSILGKYEEKAHLGANVKQILNDPTIKKLVDKIKDPKFKIIDKLDDKKNLSDEAQSLIRNIRNPISREYMKDYIRWVKKYKKHPTSLEDILGFTRYSTGKPESERVSEKEMLINFEKFVSKHGDNIILVSHNAAFDMKVIETRRRENGLQRMKKYKVFDNLAFTRFFLIPLKVTLNDKEFLDQITTKSKMQPYSSSLGKVAQAMSINPSGWHDALADVDMMIQVMQEIIKLLRVNIKLDIKSYQGTQAKKLRNF